MAEKTKKTQTQYRREVKKNFDRDPNVKIEEIDYKNVGLLQKYTNSRHKVVPRKYTQLSSKLQRKLAKEVKKARVVGLLKYTERH